MSKSNSGPTRPTANRSSKGTARSGAAGAKKPAARAPAPKSFRTRHPVMTALIPVGLVLAVIATMVVIKATGGSASPSSSHLSSAGTNQSGQTGATALSSTVAADLSVPAASLDAVGSPSSDSLPTVVSGATILKDEDGKPIVTYVGAEYCPYCAAERWAMAVALSRFWHVHEPVGDAFRQQRRLPQHPDAVVLWLELLEPLCGLPAGGGGDQPGGERVLPDPADPDGRPDRSADQVRLGREHPLLDIANKYVVTGSSYSPQVLPGLSREQIAHS